MTSEILMPLSCQLLILCSTSSWDIKIAGENNLHLKCAAGSEGVGQTWTPPNIPKLPMPLRMLWELETGF